MTVRVGESCFCSEDRELAALQEEEIALRGQVVADTSDVTGDAATLVRVSYAQALHGAELRPSAKSRTRRRGSARRRAC